MGKKTNDKTLSKRNSGHNKRNKNVEVRRNKKVLPRTHWKFKNSHKRKILKKEKHPTKSQAKTEDEIEIIENENTLFDNTGKYVTSNFDKDDIFNDWDNNTTNNAQAEDIFGKMTAVAPSNLEPRVIEAYREVGKAFTTYTSGTTPKLFNILPSTENWEELIEITEPYNWTPQAMYAATIMFTSNLAPSSTEIFMKKFLLPAVRNDIRKNKKLNVHYYNCIKKSLFKPAAFFKGLILPMANNLNSKEAAIIGSILKKCSIPVTHASAAMMKLMEYCKKGVNGVSVGALFFLRIILLKKYAMPVRVKESLVNFFYDYKTYNGVLPVIWHQCLLVFVQMYKNDLTEAEKEKIKEIISLKGHEGIKGEISKELNAAKSVHEKKERMQIG